MLRSGVPPHIGQSPLPGSDAERRAAPTAETASTASQSPAFLYELMMCVDPFRVVFSWLLVRRYFQIVQLRPELHIHEYARISLPVADRIALLDGPGGWLRFAGRPRFATCDGRPVRL